MRKAICSQGLPKKLTIDQSGSNTTAIIHHNAEHDTNILPAVKIPELVEQDHRAVKRLVRPMLGFKSFWAARCTLAGIKVMHMIKKGQLQRDGGAEQTAAEQFYALAA